MAAIGSTLLSLADQAKRKDPDGKIARIVEMLAQRNELINDIPWIEGNLDTGHRTTVRTGLPTPTWRILNKGVANTKSRTAQIDEACAILEDRSQCDVELANLGGNAAEFRMSESRAHLEGMSQEFASTFWYGNGSIAQEEFTGMAARYSSLSATNARNIINAAVVSGGDYTSIWLVGWGQDTVHGIYPKGSTAGLSHKDLGEGDAFDASQNRFRAYMDQYVWKCGLALRDWRYAVRVCNIDVSALVAKSSADDLPDLMIKALHVLENPSMCRPVFYMNRTVFQMLDIQCRDDVQAGGGLKYENVGGMPQYQFRGIPIRISDTILETETQVS
jgi:hypothetical protein